MRTIAVTLFFCTLALLVACSQPAPPHLAAAPPKPGVPAVPPEISSVAQSMLGSEAEVLVFGDLAHTGRQQVLAINRLAKTPASADPGILVTRAALAENNGGKWMEVFRCDAHLKSPSRFLAGTPITAATGWRLQYQQNADRRLQLYFTPLESPGGGHIPTIGVRWNPKVKRYQRSEEHTSELQSRGHLVCRLLLEKKKIVAHSIDV